jgi:protein O-GlcNAc transferase
LAYHNYNDRPVMESLCRLFRARVPALTAAAPHLSDGRPAAMKGQRIRVGFLSEFFVNHTIGKLYQGLIRHLDRRRFEVVVIHAPKAKRDALSQSLGALADKTLVLPVGLAGQQSAVAAAKLDVLFYPDIGMSSSTYFLAYARLAGIQVVSWGHPATTGLDTIDYFVSAGSIEPEDAQDHYTERLICLNRMPCCYQALTAPTRISSRTALGLPERCTLYGCPQSLFKIHPDFDAVLAAIAEGDPTGRIVLLEGLYPAWKCLLQTRWETTFPILLQRVLFLPRLPPEQFMALMAHLDVLLDPIHFGSGNTLYEAMAFGTPVVTWPGTFMRGRIVAGAYRQMGVADAPIALRLEDYAPLALALGRSPERRRALREVTIDAAKQQLFDDLMAVREFEIFLEGAVGAGRRGERLPVGWRADTRTETSHQGTSM